MSKIAEQISGRFRGLITSTWLWATLPLLTIVLAGIRSGIWRNSDLIRPGSDISNDLFFSLRIDQGYLTLHGYHSRLLDYHPGPFYQWTLWFGHKLGEITGIGGYLGAWVFYIVVNVFLLVIAAINLSRIFNNPKFGLYLAVALPLLVIWSTAPSGSILSAVFRYITGSAVAPLALLAALFSTWAWIRGHRWGAVSTVFTAGAAFQTFFPVSIVSIPFFAAPYLWVVWRVRQRRIDREVILTSIVALLMIAPMVARLLLVGPITLIRKYLDGYSTLESNLSIETLRDAMFYSWGMAWPAVVTVAVLGLLLPISYAARQRTRESMLILGATVWVYLVIAWEFSGHIEPYVTLWTVVIPTILVTLGLIKLAPHLPAAFLGTTAALMLWVTIPQVSEDGSLIDGKANTSYNLAASYRTVPEVDSILEQIENALGGREEPLAIMEVVSKDREGSLVIFNSTQPVALELYRRGVEVCLIQPVIHILPAELFCPNGSSSRKLIVLRMTELANPETLRNFPSESYHALGHVNGILFLLERRGE